MIIKKPVPVKKARVRRTRDEMEAAVPKTYMIEQEALKPDKYDELNWDLGSIDPETLRTLHSRYWGVRKYFRSTTQVELLDPAIVEADNKKKIEALNYPDFESLSVLEKEALLRPVKYNAKKWDLSSIPERKLIWIWFVVLGMAGGRPEKMTKCKWCSQKFAAREVRTHWPVCPDKIDLRKSRWTRQRELAHKQQLAASKLAAKA